MLIHLKETLKRIPVIGPLAVRIRRRMNTVRSSADYWEHRYKAGGSSGSGSAQRLAEFKAEFLNQFVEDQQIASVIEFGSGDGSQLTRARYPRYTGVDVAMTAVEKCREIFAGDASKSFFHAGELPAGTIAEMALSLDVVYHLVEDPVFDEYMRRLFDSASRYVVIYSSNYDQEWSGSHVRHRHFTGWVDSNRPGWHLHSVCKNRYPYDVNNAEQTSWADFYVFEPTK